MDLPWEFVCIAVLVISWSMAAPRFTTCVVRIELAFRRLDTGGHHKSRLIDLMRIGSSPS